jgi:hypothetical protein
MEMSSGGTTRNIATSLVANVSIRRAGQQFEPAKKTSGGAIGD